MQTVKAPHNASAIEQTRALYRKDVAALTSRVMPKHGYIVHTTGDFHAVRLVSTRYQMFGLGDMIITRMIEAEKVCANFNAAKLSAVFTISSPENWRAGKLAFAQMMLDKLATLD